MANTLRGARLANLEFKNIDSRGFLKLALCAIAVIPLLFATLYIWAFLDPQGSLDDVPVAVVNLDEGATLGDAHINVGDSLVERLEADESGMQWNFVDAATARKGLQEGDYYFVLTVPADFSSRIASVNSDHPVQAELKLEYNQAINIIASQVSTVVLDKLQIALLTTVSAQYYENIFLQMEDAMAGMQDAAEGANAITEALMGLQVGSGIISTTLTATADGTDALISGFSALHSGAPSLADGLKQMNVMVQQFIPLVNELLDAVSNVSLDTEQMQSFMADLNRLTQDLNDVLVGVRSIQAILADDATYPTDEDKVTAIRAIMEGENGLSAKAANLQAALAAFQASLAALQENVAQIQEMTEQLAQMMPDAQGIDQIRSGINQLSASMDALAQGSQALADGIGMAGEGAGQLVEALKLLQEGTAGLNENIGKVQEGAAALAEGLEEGVDSASLMLAGKESRIQVLSDPVEIDKGYYSKVKNYGSGFAPFFICIGLWVGALIASFLCRPLNTRVVASNASPLAAALSGFLPMAAVSALQGVLVGLALQFLIKVQVDHIAGFYAFVVLVAIVFAAIIQALVAGFEYAGRFTSVVLLILQITSSGGTFPLETTPAFFQVISPFLPMTYGVAGLRQVTAGVQMDQAWVYAGFLLLFGLVAFAFTCFIAARKRMVSVRELDPIFQP